jgi:mRNA interferase MazF
MKEGDVILTPILQADGKTKNRPAIFIREMPLFRDALVCGVSTQMHQIAQDFDELITGKDTDYVESGLISDSLIRLGFLALIPHKNIMGCIGSISPERHRRLLHRLSDYLIKDR